MLVIETARQEDLVAISRLAAATLQNHISEQWLIDHRVADPACILVARELETDAVVGFAVGCREEPCLGEVEVLAVAPDHQGAGIGGRLLRGVQNRLRNTGAMEALLHVRADDPRTKRFYERFGYRSVGLESDAYGEGADAVRLSRPL